MLASTYTTVYLCRGQYWVVRYAGDPPYQTEDSPSCSTAYEAVVWGTPITSWED